MGKHTDRLLRFAIAHPGWHTYGRDASTVRALARLAERGLIIRNTTCRQFRLASPEPHAYQAAGAQPVKPLTSVERRRLATLRRELAHLLDACGTPRHPDPNVDAGDDDICELRTLIAREFVDAPNDPDGASDARGFAAYVRGVTDAQVRGVYDRERAAGRMDMAAIATLEAVRRGLTWSDAND